MVSSLQKSQRVNEDLLCCCCFLAGNRLAEQPWGCLPEEEHFHWEDFTEGQGVTEES